MPSKNRDERREYQQAYYKKNREKHLEYQKTYRKIRQANPDKNMRHLAAKRRHTLRRYKMTDADYEKLLSKQSGVCAVCGGDSRRRKFFDVDHDHITGMVRGLLCHVCNKYVGALENALRSKADTYLAKHVEYQPHE